MIEKIIRDRINFAGLLLSDDLDMHALGKIGGLKARAEAALGAGCDVVLQCSGKLGEMKEAAAGCRNLDGAALERARAVEAFAKRPADEFDAQAGWLRFKELMGPLS